MNEVTSRTVAPPRAWQGLAVFAACVGVACLALAWPLFHAATHVGLNVVPDYYQFHWNYWWIRHALTTPGLDVFVTDYLLFPGQNNLSFYTLVPLWFPLWAAVEPLAGTLVAMNVVFVVGMALAGLCMWLLLRTFGTPPALAWPLALVFQLTPSMLLAINLTNLNYVSLFWFPLHILVWRQLTIAARHSWARGAWWALLHGLVFYATMLTDYQHMLFLTFVLVPYGLWTLALAPSWVVRARYAALGALALGVCVALLWWAGPLPAMLDFLAQDVGGLAPQPIEQADSVPFPAGFVWRLDTYGRDLAYGAVVLPLALLALALAAARRAHIDWVAWFWLAVAIAPLVLSAGPFIELAGARLPTPYVPLHNAFGGLFRVPGRFNIIAILALLVFSGRVLGTVRLGARWRRVAPALGGAALLLGVLADARVYQPMPIKPIIPQYSFYGRMAADCLDYVVLEVPVAGGSGEAWVGEFRDIETQFYGVLHHKKMLNATISRVPLERFWPWLYDDAMLAWLGQRRYLEPERVLPLLTQRVHDWPIGYIVLHKDRIGLSGPTPQEIIGTFNTLPGLLCPAWVEGDATVYRAAWHPAGCPGRTPPQTAPGVYVLDVGVPGDDFHLGWGWHYAETIFDITLRWAGHGQYDADPNEARLYTDLPPGAYTLTVRAQAFHTPRTLMVTINGTPLAGRATVSEAGLADYVFEVPARAIGDGQHVEIVLTTDGGLGPQDLDPASPDERRLSIAVDALTFTAAGG